MGKNTGANSRVALARVSPAGQDQDKIRYLVDPFANEPDPAFDHPDHQRQDIDVGSGRRAAVKALEATCSVTPEWTMSISIHAMNVKLAGAVNGSVL